jgi:hypothetical protein
LDALSLKDEPNPLTGDVVMCPRHCGPNVLRSDFTLQASFLVLDFRGEAISALLVIRLLCFLGPGLTHALSDLLGAKHIESQ